jgi:hypothetical protein
MVDGYISKSRVVEQFDWQNIKVNLKVKRVILLADSESKGLLQNQARTLLYLLKRAQQLRCTLYAKLGMLYRRINPWHSPNQFNTLLK